MVRWRPNALHVALAAIAGCGSASRPAVVEPAPRAVVVVVDRWASASVNPDAAGDLPPTATAKVVADALFAGLGARDAFSIIVLQRAGGYTQGVSCAVLELPMTRATHATEAAARAAITTGRGWDDDRSRAANSYTSCVRRGVERAIRELARAPVARGRGRIIVISDEDRALDEEIALIELATRVRATGAALSTIALAAPDQPMRSMAAAGDGRAYPARDDGDAAAIVERELAR